MSGETEDTQAFPCSLLLGRDFSERENRGQVTDRERRRIQLVGDLF